MADSGRPGYLGAAVRRPWHWLSVGGVAAAGVAAALTGAWIPLAIAGGIEALYLGVVPNSSGFRRKVDAEHDARERQLKEARIEETVQGLSLPQRGKFVEVRSLVAQIRSAFKDADPEAKAVMAPSLDRLDGLADGYLKMLVAHNAAERLLKSVRRDEIEAEKRDLELAVQTTTGRVREAKVRRLEVLSARVAKLDHAFENREILKTQLATVEDILKLLNESSLTLRDPGALREEVGRLVDGIEESQAAIHELDEIVGDTPELRAVAR